MPKATVTIPGTRKTVPARRKFKINGRKSAKSAHETSSGELVVLLMNNDRKKHHHKAAQILSKRGLNPVELVAAERAKAAESEAA